MGCPSGRASSPRVGAPGALDRRQQRGLRTVLGAVEPRVPLARRASPHLALCGADRPAAAKYPGQLSERTVGGSATQPRRAGGCQRSGLVPNNDAVTPCGCGGGRSSRRTCAFGLPSGGRPASPEDTPPPPSSARSDAGHPTAAKRRSTGRRRSFDRHRGAAHRCTGQTDPVVRLIHRRRQEHVEPGWRGRHGEATHPQTSRAQPALMNSAQQATPCRRSR